MTGILVFAFADSWFRWCCDYLALRGSADLGNELEAAADDGDRGSLDYDLLQLRQIRWNARFPADDEWDGLPGVLVYLQLAGFAVIRDLSFGPEAGLDI